MRRRVVVSLENVTKSYRQGSSTVRAVAGITLDLHAGEFVSIMGPSGSGKSTLLQLIGGLDTPDSGEITVGENRLSALSDDQLTLLRRRTIGFVFQFFNVLPTLTAAENVALPLLLDGSPLRDVRPRVDRLLDLVGLAQRAEHRPDALSGGELQRVAIARALVTEPLLLLADEPTGNLDSKTGEQVLSLLKEAGERFVQTIIMVTHDHHAAAYGDRIIALRDGMVESDERQNGKGTGALPTERP